MFEQPFEEMKASVFVESKESAMAFQYGIATLSPGFNEISSLDAIELVHKFDRLQVNVPKRLQKKWRALRMSFALAFGPEMLERI
ncbi:hypothetical protein LGIDLPPJ_00075 [Klebsiella phage KP13-27]|nr:hypothetical protein LGIDLPPJ_00075 [Klebsiella phage KP13-27]